MPKVKKNPGAPEQGLIIQNITVRPVVRRSHDVEAWRNALRSAEGLNPIRVPLYDLYADILLDPVLTSVMEKRVNGVTKVKLAFQDKTGQKPEAMKQLLKTRQFRRLRKEIQLQKAWGLTACELTVKNGKFKVYSVPRKHVKPQIGRITYEQYGIDGIDYRNEPYNRYILEVGDPDDLGLLLKAAPYVIYKRGGFGDWAHFAEIFGMPFREARYDGYNDQVRAQLEQALEQAGSASYAILPKDAEIKFHDSKSTTGSNELYDSLRRACNQELCILFLGQTETTTSSTSSGYAQSQTHAEVESEINADDREDELAIFNEEVLPILENLGFPVTGGQFVHEAVEEELTLKEKAELIIKFKREVGLQISDDYFYEEFRIPKPTNYVDPGSRVKRFPSPNDPEPGTDPALTDDPDGQVPQDGPKETKVPGQKKRKNGVGPLTRLERLRLMLADFFDLAPGN